jgi:2-polyprenyl-3-methyl-5-hydroxy-6-metoxy-1,4-benzoquinol methylase
VLPWWRLLARALANGYRNRRYGGKLEPDSKLGPWLIPLFPRLRRVLDREVRYLPKHKPDGKLLDVGFGSGQFLNLAKRIGWQVSGADPDPAAVNSALKVGLEVRQGGIEAFADATGQFDVITLNHVIEHVHDPIETLKQAFLLLKPGGVVFLETPNIDSCGHLDFKEHWRGLEIPRHLVIFNWSSMLKSLNDIGFSVIDKKYISFSNYSSLARASRAIRNNIDPYSTRKKTWRDILKEFRLSWSPFTDKYKSEFITIIASKPHLL